MSALIDQRQSNVKLVAISPVWGTSMTDRSTSLYLVGVAAYFSFTVSEEAVFLDGDE